MTWHVDVENVAGIRQGSATLEPGVNAVRGTNWGGKSSFIRAVEAALGVSRTLTEGADRGHVAVETPARTVRVDLVRGGSSVVAEGEPLLTDEYDVVRAELYACLGEDNPVRAAVRAGENLESVLTRPLDFENIDERIADRRREREAVDRELAQAQEATNRLPAVQERVTQLEETVADLRERLDAAATGETDDAGGVREELSTARAERDRTASQVERLEGSVERVEAELAAKREELASLSVPEDDVEAELAAARERLDERTAEVELLQSLYSALRRLLDEDRLDLVADVSREFAGDSLSCFVCGEPTDRERLRESVDDLGDRLASLRADAEGHRDRDESLEARREEVTQARRRRADLEDAIAELRGSLADRVESLAEARERHERLASRVEALSASVAETVETVTEVESEIKYREAELAEAREELATLEARADRLDELRAEREALTATITDLRTRKADVKERAREAFDEAMDEVLARFDTGFETARLTPTFDLVVAREGREASLDALSEGELELLGFVAALAGHASFDVGEDVPVMLLDGLGALAAANLRTLVEYLRDRAEYLVFTAYPEHDGFDGHEISPAAWTVVSDGESSTVAG